MPQNLVEAFKWYSLSAKQGEFWGFEELTGLSSRMAPEQIAVAEQLVSEWNPIATKQAV